MRYSLKLEWQSDDGREASVEVGQFEIGTCQAAAEVGLKLEDVKPWLAKLQEIVVREQLQRHCESARCCPNCQSPRNLKDYRKRRLHTVFGIVAVDAPRFEPCRSCAGSHISAPISTLLPDRSTPELRHLQALLSAVRIPVEVGHRFQWKWATHSGRK